MYGMIFIFKRWAVLVTRVSSSALLGLKSRWSQESSFSTLAMLPLVPCQIQLCSVSTEPSFRHSLRCSSELLGLKSRWSQESSFSPLAMLPLVPCQIQLCSVSTEPSFRHSLRCSSEGYGFFHEKECNMPSRDCAQSKARGGKTETHNWPDPLNRNGIDHGAFQLPGAWAATEPTGERPIRRIGTAS